MNVRFENVRYFPIVRHWARLRPIYYSREAYAVWWPNMVEYHAQKAREYGFQPRLENRKVPSAFDGCDWRCSRRGRPPEYARFVCHGACHWLVDLSLFVATEAFPKTPWRIVTSEEHSSVWNGNCELPVLYDPNFLALGVEPREAMRLASTRGRVLLPCLALSVNRTRFRRGISGATE
jgi:hypothetical protein